MTTRDKPTLVQRLQNAWWGRRRRTSFETRREFVRDQARIYVERAWGKVLCARGQHWEKFDTSPYCARGCGKRVR